jgi:isopentenyldiphosphate isomerase
MEKESFPGLYDTSSAGHIPAGEEPVPSALRELQEELGIEASADQLQYAGTFRIRYEKEFHGRLFRDNEVTKVYVYSEPVKIDSLVLQKSEVDEVQWFDLNEVWEEIRQTRERFCVPSDGLDVLKRFLESGAKYERRLI